MNMDDTLLFMPPCCVDKKLPKAVMQAPQRMLTFYTQGDVTMEKFYKAISYLLIEQQVMVVAMPTVLGETLVFLQQCFEREWISHLVLSTNKDCSNLMERYLEPYKDKILYSFNRNVSAQSSHMVLYNKDRALTLSGPMYDRPSRSLSAYSLMFYPNYSLVSQVSDWGNPLKNILLPDVLRHRQQVHKDYRQVEQDVLKRFLTLDFPPYKQKEESGYHGDHHNFSDVY